MEQAFKEGKLSAESLQLSGYKYVAGQKAALICL